MSKKSKPAKKKKSLSANIAQAERLLKFVDEQILDEDYEGAVTNCERLLNFLPRRTPLRVEVLAQLGTTHLILQNYPQCYAALTEAVELSPNDAALWYNRGQASQLTMRFGQAFKDFTRAMELNKAPELSKPFAESLESSRRIVEESCEERGPDFTLDQLIEQEALFQRGLALMEASQWDGSAQAFQAAIAMGDCLPSPWGNLGTCLLMQERYDEAEAAFKRALVIDPDYAIAKNNLKLLPETRRTGPPQIYGIHDPFRDGDIKPSITFIQQ